MSLHDISFTSCKLSPVRCSGHSVPRNKEMSLIRLLIKLFLEHVMFVSK